MFNNYLFSLLFFLTVNVQFFSQVTASFTSDVTSGCSPLQVNFTDNSVNSLTNKWDFGNGSPIVTNNNNPISTYSIPGLYTVTLIAFNGADSDTIVMVDYIEVYQKPTSNFTYISNNLCEDDNLLSFTNTSIGATSYLWDFGDGNSSNDINPTHQFLQTGDFTIKLNAYNANCADLKTIGPITIHPTPILNTSLDTTFSCDSNYNFTFSGSSSNTTITDWEWSFGNGVDLNGTSSQLYSYGESGNFSPKLVATSSNGCVDSSFLLQISIAQIDNYIIQPSVINGCPPLSVDFNISPSVSIQSSNWNFGDTNTATGVTNSSNSYLNSGNFSVSSTITDLNGCIQNINMNGLISVDTSPTGTFNTSSSTGCPPLNVNFSVTTSPSNTVAWDFGDTTFSSNPVDNNTYLLSGTYYPELTLTSPNGCTKTYIVDTIQAGLTLTNFSASPTTGCATLEVDFTNSAPASATSFLWEFGDGNTSTDPNPTHTYDTIGEYSVKFTCSDTSGCSSTYIINNMITSFGEDDVELPNADTIEVCSPYTFEADASNIGESYWNWDFGDGNYGSGANVSHVFTKSGVYTVLLNADAPNACMYNITNYAIINVNNMNVDLDISINDDCSVGTFSVNNNSSGVIQHQWNMGDFNGYNTADINHPYNTTNSYMVTYEALSSSGCVVTKYFPVIFNCDANGDPIVDPPPPIVEPPTDDTVVISIQGPLVDPVTNDQITQTCGPELVDLSSPFSNAISYHWDFGDGNTSTEQDPSHYYSDSGKFDLFHIATYPNGDKDTLTIVGFIDQYILDASFILNKTPLCNEADFQFNNLSTFATSWEWKLDSTIISSQSNGNITLPLNDSVRVLNLKIEDDYGCEDERQQTLFLYQPLVLIEQDTFACNSNNITFECSVVGDPIHSWDLNDGTVLGPDTTISHSYYQNGFYQVVLSLDDLGCVRDINLDSLEIYQPDATFNPNNILPICNEDSALFIANDRSFNNSKYEWSGANVLGNGDSTWIQFNNPGEQVISLSIKKRTCRSTIISDTIIVNKANAYFSSTQLNGCIPIDVTFQDSSVNPVQWDWSFGDGNNSNTQNPTHTYQFMPTDSINLTITDINGCKDSIKSVIVNELDADFTVDDSVVCTNTPVVFSGIDNIVSNWNWDFGDGNTSTDSVPTHYYQTGGFFEVKLIVSDGQGCNDSVIKNNYIEVQNVEADFSFSAPGTCPPIITTFDNNSIGATNYVWDFGDGANNIINNNPSVTHTYDSSGNYNLSLIANNLGGCSDTLVLVDSLIIPGPQLNFSIDQTIGCDSLTINITDSSINTVTYKWDFNDGNGDSLNVNPTHTYNSVGVYTVSLVGIDASGCGTLYRSADTIKIFPSPVIDVSILDSNLCNNTNLNPVNNTVADNHSWNYGTQSYSSSNPSILVDVTGPSQLSYIATNNDGNCSNNISFNIVGHQIPDVSIIDQGIICTNIGIVDYNSLNSNILSTITWSGTGITDQNNGLLDPLLITDSSLITASFDSICLSQDSIYVIIDNPPDASILTPNTTYCSLDLISDPQVLNNGGIWSGTNVNPLTGAITSPLSPGIYEYLYILNNTNCSDSSTYELNILYQNDASITSDSSVCENAGTYTLNAIDTGGVWSGPFINSTTGEININLINSGNYEYVYNISGLCPDIDTLNLEVIPFIAAQINPSISYCEGTDSIQLTATTNIGDWSGLLNSHLTNGLFLTSQIPDGTFEVYYSITSSCPDIDTLNLTILPEPDIEITFNQELPCIGYPISIVNNSLNLSSENYDWFVNDSLYYQNFNEPYFVFDTGFYQIKTTAINQYNCQNEKTFDELIYVYDSAALEKAEIIRSTVFENRSVYTEWKDTSLVMNPLGKNLIYRSVNNGDYNLLVELDSSISNYLDSEVDVFNNNYSYLIVSKNVCEVSSSNSNNGNNILLKFEKPEEFKTKLDWNIYDNWDDGINRYEIQKLNKNGQWELVQPSENLNNSIIIDE